VAETLSSDLLDVWVEDHLGLRQVGVLERFAEAGHAFQSTVAFHYLDGLADTDAVSITMPVRRAAYQPKVAGLIGNLPPIFDQNMPEGALRDYLARRYLKVIDDLGDFDLLRLAGNRSIGRVRVVPHGEQPDPRRPDSPGVAAVLKDANAQRLLESLFEQLARYSGVSGVQPKVLMEARDEPHLATPKLSGAHRLTLQNESTIIKAAGRDFPSLSINEYLCLYACQMSGLPTARTELSENGEVLAIARFDRDELGRPLGFEDMACLSALTAQDKYKGSYEEMVRRLALMIEPARRHAVLLQLYQQIVMSCVLGNGDAHLKNFGLLYIDPTQPAWLAPAYDVCCTTAYLREDQMALSMNRSKAFPNRAGLILFGRVACRLAPSEIERVFENVAVGVEYAAVELEHYRAMYQEFDVRCGEAMRREWETSMRYALGFDHDYRLPKTHDDVASSRPVVP